MNVPQGYSSTGYQRLLLSATISWPEALTQIYRAVGCEHLVHKPVLAWKFDKLRAKEYNLGNEEEWSTLKKDVGNEGRKQKAGAAPVPVDVIIRPENVSAPVFAIEQSMDDSF
jgi:hypothetical protein